MINAMHCISKGMCFLSSVAPPASVSITSNPPSPVSDMSTVTVTCTVELNNSAILESELSLVTVEAELSTPNEPTLSLSNPIVSGTTFTYSTQLNSFERSDSGNYLCTATVRPLSTATYLTGVGILSNTIRITVGMFNTKKINNNSRITCIKVIKVIKHPKINFN